MQLFTTIVVIALQAFFIVLLFRLVMEYVLMFARSFRPKGALVIALEVTYSVTDPPLKAIRRIVPPLRLGGAQLDLAFIILLILLQILIQVVASA